MLAGTPIEHAFITPCCGRTLHFEHDRPQPGEWFYCRACDTGTRLPDTKRRKKHVGSSECCGAEIRDNVCTMCLRRNPPIHYGRHLSKKTRELIRKAVK